MPPEPDVVPPLPPRSCPVPPVPVAVGVPPISVSVPPWTAPEPVAVLPEITNGDGLASGTPVNPPRVMNSPSGCPFTHKFVICGENPKVISAAMDVSVLMPAPLPWREVA